MYNAGKEVVFSCTSSSRFDSSVWRSRLQIRYDVAVRVLFSKFPLRLSRACLGKSSCFAYIHWRKKDAFLHRDRAAACASLRLRFPDDDNRRSCRLRRMKLTKTIAYIDIAQTFVFD